MRPDKSHPRRAGRGRIRRVVRLTPWLLCLLSAVACRLTTAPCRADAPGEAAAAVHRLMQATRSKDPATFLAALADDYFYNGLRKADLTPFGFLQIISDRLLYRVSHLDQSTSGVAAAVVDIDFTGHLNLEAGGLGRPAITGTSRLWIEVRRQPDGTWKVTAVRPIRVRFRHADTPFTWVGGMTVNGLSSVRVAPGAPLSVEGRTLFGVRQLVAIGASSANLVLNLETNRQMFETWRADLTAPATPGRYYVDTVSVILLERPDGSGLYLSWDEVSVPVVIP
jgi:hypothetical protein